MMARTRAFGRLSTRTSAYSFIRKRVQARKIPDFCSTISCASSLPCREADDVRRLSSKEAASRDGVGLGRAANRASGRIRLFGLTGAKGDARRKHPYGVGKSEHRDHPNQSETRR